MRDGRLGRDVQVRYNAQGFISTLVDFAGRQISYAYYASTEPGGSTGDLKLVTAPAVTGTLTQNDFPGGKTIVYTYTKGFNDERLNHNLLTITDPKNQTYLRNTYSGVRDASPSAVNAATALGMTPLQVLRHVRLPLAAPVIMAGIRTAAVINVGTATLAAFVGAGGLGDPIVAGLSLSDTRMILSGAIPAALLALIVDLVLAAAERAVAPTTH